MIAATATEWLTAARIGTGLFLPGALLILSLDHDLTPRMPSVSLEPVLAAVVRVEDAAERAAQRARLLLAAWLLVLAWHLEQPKGAVQ